MVKNDNKTKTELIAEIKNLEAQLASNSARHQLAILLEIETALARETDLDGIYEAVGDKLIEIFGAQTVAFYSVDRIANLMYFPYTNEKGVKEISREPVQMNSLYQHVLDHGTTFVVNGNFQDYIKEFLDYQVPWGELPRSVVVVPIINTPEHWVSISLQDMDNDDVFSEENIQLLETLAASMSVALKNAELFEETNQRNSELAILNIIQYALVSNMDIGSIYESVGEQLDKVFPDSDVVLGTYSPETDYATPQYLTERGKRLDTPPVKVDDRGFMGKMIREKKTILVNENLAAQAKELESTTLENTDSPKAHVFVPMIVKNEVRGVVVLQNMYRENVYKESDVRLLETIANSMSVGLENARLFEETNQRIAELAVINSIQEGLAKELDFQAIIDMVGEKIRSIFKSDTTVIGYHDEKQNLMVGLYYVDRDERQAISRPYGVGFSEKVIESGEPLLVGTKEELDKYSKSFDIASPGSEKDLNQSILAVPTSIAGKYKGVISVQSYRKFAYTENDLRLLQTLGHSMSIALESAHLFDETQRLLKETEERNAELAIINGIQDGLASKLDIQDIFDMVGERLSEIFIGHGIALYLYDEKTDLATGMYLLERGVRHYPPPFKPGPLGRKAMEVREPLSISTRAEFEELGAVTVEGTEPTLSGIYTSLITGDRVIGALNIENAEKENAFTDSDIRLIKTITGSMSVALESARLFDETQRLLEETNQRIAELAVINSVQEGLAASLDIQGIYDLVGEKVREIFNAEIVILGELDSQTGLQHVNFLYEQGERFYPAPVPISGLMQHIIDTGKTVVVNENTEEVLSKFGTYNLGESPNSALFVPMKTGNTVTGIISLQDVANEHVYQKNDIRLLETLSASMSVALENARLFEETNQRNSELAVINSVQEGLASKLDMQAIYNLVGDKVTEITGSEIVVINTWDKEAGTIRYEYIQEKGERPGVIEREMTALNREVLPQLELGETQIFNEGVAEMLARYDHTLPAGEMPLTVINIPLKTGNKINTFISLQDTQKEFAFEDTTIRLVETLAHSMGIALENARLFDEVQKRNQNIREALDRQTATSDILHIIANSPGEIQPVLDSVAQQAAKLCAADDVQIYQVEGDKLPQVAHYGELPGLKDGEALPLDRGLMTGRAILERRTYHMDAGKIDPEEYPISAELQKRLKHRSVIVTPLVTESGSVGAIVARRNEVREFSDIEIDLLSTFADQVAIAIENVRLFDETKRLLAASQQQAEELRSVNTVSQALSSEIELDALIDLIGTQVQQLFSADVAYVGLLDQETNIIDFPYSYGEKTRPLQLGEGLTSRVITAGEPLLINQDTDWNKTKKRIGVQAKSYLGVPITIGKEVIGVISVQSTEWANMYGEKDVRLLSTIAANVGAAIKNANLFTEVEHQKEYYEALISSAPVAIITIGLDGEVTGWSPAAELLFGYTEEEALGQHIDDLVANHEDVREEAELYTQKFLQEIGKIQLKSRRTHKDGHLIDVAINAMPVYNEGEMSGYIAIYNDVSALEKARRDAEEANHAKSAFLANMSHELRTPLNAIIGFTRIVKRKGKEILPEKQIGNLEKVLVSAEHLLGLINTVLDISKIEAGRMDLHISTFEVKPLIDLALVTSQPLIRSEDVSLVSNVPDQLPVVKSDLEKIKQILLNLLSNAAKFTHQGQISVDVRQEDGFIRVDVADSGIGISAQALELIFEEFQQADVSTTREYGGTGLGLSISRSLAQLLGGDLSVVSEIGEGSTFTLTFPVELGLEEKSEEGAEFNEIHSDAPLVLVIDDNENAILLMRESLQDAGYQVAVARNGEEGLQKARDLRPFAITLDIMMPKKDGWQVLHDLKQNPSTRGIPVIMISIVDKKALGFRLGAADYLVKPLDEDAVLGSLDNLRKKNGGQELKRLLVVDDDPNIPDMIRQLLEGSRHQIETARDGEQAWEKLNQSKPDAILLDLMMPHLDGFGLLQRISEVKELRQIPVIVLTAKLLSNSERKSLKDSVQQVIHKQGLSGEDLLAEISETIRQTL